MHIPSVSDENYFKKEIMTIIEQSKGNERRKIEGRVNDLVT
jgi:hypothetical protein